jgi:hypothetical protein
MTQPEGPSIWAIASEKQQDGGLNLLVSGPRFQTLCYIALKPEYDLARYGVLSASSAKAPSTGTVGVSVKPNSIFSHHCFLYIFHS